MTDTPDPAAIAASPIVRRILEAARLFDALPRVEQENLNSQIAWLGREVAAAVPPEEIPALVDHLRSLLEAKTYLQLEDTKLLSALQKWQRTKAFYRIPTSPTP